MEIKKSYNKIKDGEFRESESVTNKDISRDQDVSVKI